jgi:formamidopyrimidine-DNA glycosylase
MPELPEVETVRRCLDSVLAGQRIVDAEVLEDSIVLKGAAASTVREQLVGRTVSGTGRKGKTWWIEFDDEPWLYGHLGMSGWIRELGAPTIRLKEHGEAPLDDPEGRPRFLKLLLTAESGRRVALTDGRRLARLWVGAHSSREPALEKLGPDAWLEQPDLRPLMEKRKAPIKAILMDQAIVSGIGNWIADEVLYQARIRPSRPCNELKPAEWAALQAALAEILDLAVRVGADSAQFPAGWMFHHRWGGGKGAEFIDGHSIIRETVGGRTTAWCPDLQK